MLSILRRIKFPQLFKHNYLNYTNYNNYSTALLVTNSLKFTSSNVEHNLQILRYKSKNKKSRKTQNVTETETDEENEQTTWEDQVTDKTTKIMQIPVKSLRVDGVLKASFGIARNKIDTLFYESKLRVNGAKILKKSHLVDVGDEIDIVKGVSITNPDFLTVARCEILDIKEKGDTFNIKVRRCKSLTVENYEDRWKPSDTVD